MFERLLAPLCLGAGNEDVDNLPGVRLADLLLSPGTRLAPDWSGLVEGNSLAEFSAACARRDAAWLRRSAALLATVARAIHYAHQRGVLHRDLKPSNILVDDRGQPRVTDFGLAKIHEADAGLTRSGAVLGSPNYMPPEQAAGPAHTLTTAADVYSLGAILYQLICGRPPFEAPTPIETMRRVLDTDPVPPHQINAAVDRDLESICRKCLEREPQRRYPSAADLATDLDRWLAGQPTQARPLPAVERASRWARRNATLALLTFISAVCLLTLAIGAALAFHRIQMAHREAHALLRRLQLEQVESYFADGDSARGIALLAHLLRAEPDDDLVGRRLKSALELRPMGRPFAQPWLSGSEILVLGFDQTDTRSIALSRQGDLHLRDLADGHSSDHRLSAGQPLAHATLSADATRLATAHPDGSVRIWFTDRPDSPHHILPHPASIRFLEFDPEGARLATGSEDGSIRIWNVDEGNLVQSPLQHPALSRTAAFSPDSRQLATGCDDGIVRLWPVETPHTAESFEMLPDGIRVIKFDPAGERLAAGTVSGHIRIRALSSAASSPLDLFFPAALTDLQFSPDGRLLAAAGWSPHAAAQVWDARTGQVAGPPLAHRSNVTGVRFSPDGQMLLTLSLDTTARLWNTADWTPALDPMVHVGGVARGAWTRDSRRLATGSYAGVVWWDLPDENRGVNPLFHSHTVLAVGTVRATGWLLTYATDHTLRIWDSDQTQPLHEFRLELGQTATAVFSDSGHTLLVLTDNHEVHAYHTKNGQPRRSPVRLDEPLAFVVASPKDDTVLAATAHGSLWQFSLSFDSTAPAQLSHVQALNERCSTHKEIGWPRSWRRRLVA